MLRLGMLVVLAGVMGMVVGARGADVKLLIGTHVAGAGKGIRVAQLDTETGKLSVPTLAAESEEGAFLALTRDGGHLYVTNSVRTFQGVAHMGGVSAFAVEPTGKLRLLNQVASGGENPPYISLDRTQRYALVANYNGNGVPGEGGSVAVFTIKGDGSLGERTGFDQHKGTSVDPVRQTQAYAHSALTDPSNLFALVADLGLDKVFVYQFDAATGKIAPNVPAFVSVKPGSGPRHMTFDATGKVMYLATEMASTVVVFGWDDQKGILTQRQEVSMLPPDFHGTSTAAEIRVHPNGKWLYASNRGHDSIVQYAIDAATGQLTVVGWVGSGGTVPRNFEFSPDGKWLVVANQGDETVAVFGVGAEDGKLKQVGAAMKVESPFGVRFLK